MAGFLYIYQAPCLLKTKWLLFYVKFVRMIQTLIVNHSSSLHTVLWFLSFSNHIWVAIWRLLKNGARSRCVNCGGEIDSTIIHADNGLLQILQGFSLPISFWNTVPLQTFNVIKSHLEQMNQTGLVSVHKILNIKDVDVCFSISVVWTWFITWTWEIFFFGFNCLTFRYDFSSLVQIFNAVMMEQGPVLTVTCMVQQVHYFKNAKGEIVQGDPVCYHVLEFLFHRDKRREEALSVYESCFHWHIDNHGLGTGLCCVLNLCEHLFLAIPNYCLIRYHGTFLLAVFLLLSKRTILKTCFMRLLSVEKKHLSATRKAHGG